MDFGSRDMRRLEKLINNNLDQAHYGTAQSTWCRNPSWFVLELDFRCKNVNEMSLTFLFPQNPKEYSSIPAFYLAYIFKRFLPSGLYQGVRLSEPNLIHNLPLAHRSVQIPLDNIERLWQELKAFDSETDLNRTTAKTFMIDISPAHMQARCTVLHQLVNHVGAPNSPEIFYHRLPSLTHQSTLL